MIYFNVYINRLAYVNFFAHTIMLNNLKIVLIDYNEEPISDAQRIQEKVRRISNEI